jgi:hypothetical protein
VLRKLVEAVCGKRLENCNGEFAFCVGEEKRRENKRLL